MTTCIVFFALACKEDMEIFQMDVKIAFLHGDLQEDIYIQQPKGFVENGREHLVCKFK